MVAKQLVVGAEGEMQLTVTRFQLLEYLTVKLFIIVQLLGYVVTLVCQMAFNGVDNVTYGVYAPHRAVVEGSGTQGIEASRATA